MDLKFGLISADSHGQLGKDAYTSRMSQAKWGDRIPHVIEVRAEKFDFPVERWVVNAPQEAIAAPRFSHIEGAKVGLEPDFWPDCER